MTDNYEQFDERLERFLKDQMTDEERQQLLAELKADPELMQRAQVMALTIQQMDEARREEGEKVIDIIKNTAEQQFRDKLGLKPAATIGVTAARAAPQPKRPLWRRAATYAVAACLLGVVAFGLYTYTYRAGNELPIIVPDYDYPDEALQRGTADSVATALKPLFDDVANGSRLSDVSKQLDSLYRVATSEEFNDLTNHANEIGWNAAVAYIKDGKKTEAIAILKRLCQENEGKLIATRAQELINQLEAK